LVICLRNKFCQQYIVMKKNVVSLLLVLLSIWATAQNKFELSFTVSPSVNWMSPSSNEVQNNQANFGYDFGVGADFFFDEEARYAITTGLLISQTGGELTYNTGQPFSFAGNQFSPGTSIQYRLEYVEIPIALKMRTKQFYRWSYWGLFGLSGGVNVSAKGDSSDGFFDKESIGEEVKLFNLSLNLGLGGEFDLGERNALVLGLVYKNGFVDVTSKSLGNKTTLNSLSFKLGLVF